MISDEILFEEPKIELVGVTQKVYYTSIPIDEKKNIEAKLFSIGPEELSVYGAYGCFEEKSSHQLMEGDLNPVAMGTPFSQEKIDIKKGAVLRESAGRGHGSVLDQNYFIYSVEGLTRADTLQFCLPEYLAHLQQSLRRAKADRGFYVPKSLRESELFKEVKQTLYDSFLLYEEMANSGIEGEDARFILPLLTKTNIQTGGDARELMHLHGMNEQGEVPSYVQDTVNKMIEKASEIAPRLFKKREKTYEVLAWYPSPQLYSSGNSVINNLIENYDSPDNVILLSYSGVDEIDETCIMRAIKDRNETDLANLKHIHFEFLTPMSIACYHQSTRQRTWNHSIESIYDAAERMKMVFPPKIRASSEYYDKYNGQNYRMMELYYDLIDDGIPRSEAIGVVPHSLEMYDWIHVNGWNVLHSIGKRTCKEAQWEIRGIAKQMADIIKKVNPDLGKWAEPQCITYRGCPEKEPCGYEKKIKEFWD